MINSPTVSRGLIMAPKMVNEYKYEDGQWWYYIKKAGTRERARLMTCKFCNTEFPARQRRYTHYDPMSCQKKECRSKAMRVGQVGNREWREKEGINHPNWSGGIIIRNGYAYVYLPKHYSLTGTKGKYVRRCRLVMEQHLGRPLEKWEQVHHKNNIRDDDRIDNLEIWIISQPAGHIEYYCPQCNCDGCKNKRTAQQA